MQEPGSATVVTYPRRMEGLVRQPDKRRAEARKGRTERNATEKQQVAEEVRRLKSLHHQAIRDKYAALRLNFGLNCA